MSDVVIASAPTRIDFAGGTLDIPPLYLWHQPAMTVNVAIDLRAEVRARRRKGRAIRLYAAQQRRQLLWGSRDRISWTREPALELVTRLIGAFAPPGGLDVTVDSRAPAGGGVGGSSALAVAVTAALAALAGQPCRGARLIERAMGVETQAIRVPTGYQDYYAAVYGGASVIEFGLDGVRRSPVADGAFLGDLERHLLLIYLGQPRFSGTNNWELFKRRIEGDRRVVRFFDALKDHAVLMRDAFLRRDLPGIADLLNRDWETRRRALPGMSSPRIDALVRTFRRAGALGARVCGAGGGGCLALLIDPDARARLTALAQSVGVSVLSCAVSRRGLLVRRQPSPGDDPNPQHR